MTKTSKYNPNETYTHSSVKVDKVQKHLITLMPKSSKYPVDLTYENTTGRLLDMLLQVNRKPWATPELMKALLDAIEVACKANFNNNAQGTYCPFGRYMRVNWKNKKAEPIEVVTKATVEDAKLV